jgi:hypothetical protein
MKKIVRLTENDLVNMINRIIKESAHSKDFPKNDLDLMVKELRKNDIEYGWPLNKDFIIVKGTDYRIYYNQNGTYKIQDSDAKHGEDKVSYTSPKFGHKENQTPERNASEGVEYVSDWLKRKG